MYRYGYCAPARKGPPHATWCPCVFIFSDNPPGLGDGLFPGTLPHRLPRAGSRVPQRATFVASSYICVRGKKAEVAPAPLVTPGCRTLQSQATRIGAAPLCYGFLQVPPAPRTACGPRRSTVPLSEAPLGLSPHPSNGGKGDHLARPELRAFSC